jgi:septal ring factor EnvC (AmiA/AmiB activator)
MNDIRITHQRRSGLGIALGTAIGVAALALAACASTPPPTAQMAVSNAALAHAVGAGSVELAPAETALARDKMSRANLAIAAKDNDTALALAQQAQLDAQLAEAKTESSKARKSADALQDASRALREEMSRKSR